MSQLKLLILALLIFIFPSAKCSDLGRDGFNIYKDYLRARSEDNLEDPSIPDRMLYFYRTPVQLSSGFLSTTEQEYRKRTGNAYKNHMLNKELLIGEMPKKRASKTAIAFTLPSRQPYNILNNPEDEMEPPVSQY